MGLGVLGTCPSTKGKKGNDIMRARHLIHRDIFDSLGGFRTVASLCCVEEGTARKWTQDPEISGRDIPFVKFQDILREAGRDEQINNLPLQHLVNELLNDHVLGLCHRRSILQEEAYEISAKISAILLGQTMITKNGASHG